MPLTPKRRKTPQRLREDRGAVKWLRIIPASCNRHRIARADEPHGKTSPDSIRCG